MRSRYTAYTRQDMDYIEQTTDPQSRASFDREASEQWAKSAEFFKLEILRSTDEGNKGTVEFRAHFRQGGEAQVHHEVSKFRKQKGQWFFRDGRVLAPANPS